MRKPEVYLSVGRNRRKSNDGKYYLKNETEFEIEIFNPTTDRIGCKIELDGKLISNSLLVLNPGQRVFLERYIDDNRKFKFSTYHVENSEEAKSAILLNGDVTVRFYKEKTPTHSTTPIWISANWPPSDWWSTTVYGTCGQTSSLLGTQSITNCTIPCNYSAQIETGRSEMGSFSDQSLRSIDVNFDQIWFHSESFKMLPESMIQANEIRQYCTQCRCRIRKSSWKWCPQCGNKL